MCLHPWQGLYILLVGIILNGGKKQAFFFTHSHSESNLTSRGVSNCLGEKAFFTWYRAASSRLKILFETIIFC